MLYGINSPEFFDRKKFLRRTRGDEANRIGGNFWHQPAQRFLGAIVGEKRFPARGSVTITIGARRRSELSGGRAGNKRSAPHVPLDQTFGFEFGVSVGHGGAVDAQVGSEFAAGRDAVAGAQFPAMDQRAQLIAQLNIERDMTFSL